LPEIKNGEKNNNIGGEVESENMQHQDVKSRGRAKEIELVAKARLVENFCSRQLLLLF